ncbi:hypothetical protein ABID21_004940 [Pseudorhizobium tarimense]|uniref:Uncharacterized protein n=1 Tax=Pseudorhizobium tarimense TaxID=1079109 RepID=A0ABV2HE26_9HYPH
MIGERDTGLSIPVMDQIIAAIPSLVPDLRGSYVLQKTQGIGFSKSEPATYQSWRSVFERALDVFISPLTERSRTDAAVSAQDKVRSNILFYRDDADTGGG